MLATDSRERIAVTPTQDTVDAWIGDFGLARNRNDLIDEMMRYEWLTHNKENVLQWTDERAQHYVHAFLYLNQYVEFHEIEYADCPCYFSVAQPRQSPRMIQHYSPCITAIQDKSASGVAFSKRQAVEKCLGEAIETLSMVRRGEENLVYDTFNNLKERALHPDKVIQFSDEQFINRFDWNQSHLPQHHIPEPFDADALIAWAPLNTMCTEHDVLYPAKLLYWGFEYELPGYSHANSNGCAVGETQDEAITRAILELIERDATGIWWYGQHNKPRIPSGLIENSDVLNLLQWLRQSNRRLELFEITSDLGIPVVAAATFDASTGAVATGYSCAFDVQTAITHAVAETMQMLVSMIMLNQRIEAMPERALSNQEHELLRWVENPRINTLPVFRPTHQVKRISQDHSDETCTLAQITKRLADHNCQVYWRPYDKVIGGFHSVKCIATGLIDKLPRQGSSRFARFCDIAKCTDLISL